MSILNAANEALIAADESEGPVRVTFDSDFIAAIDATDRENLANVLGTLEDVGVGLVVTWEPRLSGAHTVAPNHSATEAIDAVITGILEREIAVEG